MLIIYLRLTFWGLLVVDESVLACSSVALRSLQGSMKEVVSVSNMGVAKGGPIIQDRDRLLLKFTDGSECTSDGQKLSYSTLIYLACSRGAQVRRICALFNVRY